MLYGNFIGVQYVFAGTLDPVTLQAAVDRLIVEHPYLSARYDKPGQQVTFSPEGVPVVIGDDASGIIEGYAEIGTGQYRRSDFVIEHKRRDIQQGISPLMTVTLTPFPAGGCILGLAISHVLVDAAGFHRLARRLAEIYTARQQGTDLPDTQLTNRLDVFEFGTDRSKTETLTALAEAELPKPVKIKGMIGGVIRSAIIRELDKLSLNSRIVIAMNAVNIARLKQTVLIESGEDWISTNMALSAHFTRIMARLIYGEKPREEVQIGQLLDLRSRYFETSRETQAEFIGNAILIHTETARFPGGLQNTSRAALARFFKRSLTRVNADYLQQRLDLISDGLRHGYNYPGLDLKNPMIALNNQSKMPVYDLAFGTQIPLRVIPQDVGDNIMFFPTPDGGVEIYIRDILKPERQEKLLTREWQDRIFDF